MTVWAFDILALLALVWLAWRAMTARRIEVAVVTFLPYGLLMALVWARLRAPDIAIAEAAIGAGLTTALLIAAANRIRRRSAYERAADTAAASSRSADARLGGWGKQLVGAVLACVVGGLLAAAVANLPAQQAGLSPQVEANLSDSGAGNPVTAVLLNFRGYDTLLEIAVLLLALIGVMQLRRETPGPVVSAEQRHSLVLDSLVHVIVPLIVIVSGYLLWRGGDAPGGAFQAGALLAGAGVLLILNKQARPAWLSARVVRAFVAAGLLMFGGVALNVMWTGRNLLEYPIELAKPLILAIEAAATVSIAVILTMLFGGVLTPHRAPSLQGGAS